MKKNEPIDFYIEQTPTSIVLDCLQCETHISIPWEEVDVPDSWSDDWGYVECPICGFEIKLGDYDI